MTHDELLAEVQFHQGFQMGIKGFQLCSALRAVVELHSPIMIPTGANSDGDMWFQEACKCGSTYPCVNIQAIQKELKV